MWQDDEDNNPYGSFNPDSTSPVLDTSCKIPYHKTCSLVPSGFFSLLITRCISLIPDHDRRSSSPPVPRSSREGHNAGEFGAHHPANGSDDGTSSPKSLERSHLPRRKGPYDSRLQQLIFESPDLEIFIADAGKSADGGFIVYRIRTAVRLG